MNGQINFLLHSGRSVIATEVHMQSPFLLFHVCEMTVRLLDRLKIFRELQFTCKVPDAEAVQHESETVLRFDSRFIGKCLELKGVVLHFGEYTYLLSCQELHNKINTTLMSVHLI